MSSNIEFKDNQDMLISNLENIKIITLSDEKGNKYTLDASNGSLKLKYQQNDQDEISYTVEGLAAALKNLLDIKSTNDDTHTVLEEKLAEKSIVEAIFYARDLDANDRISSMILDDIFPRQDVLCSYLDKKADVKNVYNKEEVDEELNKKADVKNVYDKGEVDRELNKKADVNPITKIMSSDSESHTYEDSGYGSSLNEGHEYEEVSHYREEKSEFLEKSLQSLKLPKEEPIYATIPIEHIEAKRKRKQEQQSKHTVSPKLPTSIVIPEKTSFISQEVKQESQAIFKDVFTVSSQSKNLGHANQKTSTKPRIVGVTLKKSAESISLRAENQDYRQVVPKVEVPVVKEVINCKMDSKVKAIVEKFEQNQVKEYTDMQTAKNKDIMAAQSGVDMKRNPLKIASHAQSFFVQNNKSLENPIKEQFDHEPCKNSFITDVNVKQLAVQYVNSSN